MRAVRGFFVCGQDHQSADLHAPNHVTEAVRKPKEKAPMIFNDGLSPCSRDHVSTAIE